MRRLLLILAVAAAAIYLNNASFLASPAGDGPTLLAHRGLHQTFDRKGVGNDTCTAERIDRPAHEYLENTLPSMEAAFELGADWIEIDIHPTTDGRFAVFHDWTLDCRTDGSGVTREQDLAALKRLDIGYGYTADDGRSHPFRGQGVGLMPSLEEVFARFPNGRFVINIKSNDPEEGTMLAERLAALERTDSSRLIVYGGTEPIEILRAQFPGLRTATHAGTRTCLIRYIALGWSGYVPAVCHDMMLVVPVNYAGWLWGWPDRFIARMNSAASLVFATGPLRDGYALGGINDEETFNRLPRNYSGGIWTDRIDVIAPLLALD